MSVPGDAASKSQRPKKKVAPVPLTKFLKPEVTNWADEDDESDMPALPTAPGRGGGAAPPSYGRPLKPERDLSRLPTGPPYKIFVGNLLSDVTAKELGEYFLAFFKVVDVLLLKRQETGTVKGAFVEFATLEDLQGALTHNSKLFKDRPLKIDVAERPERGYLQQGGHDNRARRSFEDDRRGPYGGGEFGTGYDPHPGRGGYDDRQDFGSRGGYNGRGPPIERDYRERGPQGRRGGPEGVYGDRPRGGFSRGGDEEIDGARWGHRHASPSHQQSLPEPTEQPTPPVERKKLVLAPRSKPLGADTETSATETSHAVDKPTKLNPFGEAKPVDASARLRELEEKIAKQKAEEAVRAKEKEGRERSQAAAAPAPGAEDKQIPREGQTNTQPSDRSTGALPSISGSSLPYGQWAGPPGMYDGRGNGGRGSERGRGYDRGGRGYDRGRGDGGRGVRGRRGRGREGRGRQGDFGRERGGPRTPPQGADTPPLILQKQEVHAAGSRDSRQGAGGRSGFQEAVDKRSRGRTRGWETHTPAIAASLPRPSQQASEHASEEKEVSKVTNMFNILNADA